MRPEVVIHHLNQAKAALKAAVEVAVAVQLRSAPGAAAYAGVGYCHALSEALGHEVLVDCGDDAGLVMAALRTGCRRLTFSGSGAELERLSQMADRCSATLRRPMAPSPPRLALSPEDDYQVVVSWLRSEMNR